MIRHAIIFLLVLRCLLIIAIPTSAQSPQITQSSETKAKRTKSQPERDTARLSEARQAYAIQVVSSLADEARSYKNESLAVKVQAWAANLLWQADRDRARILFKRAWDTAQTVDKEGRRRHEEDRQRLLSGRGGTAFIPFPPNLRAEVLRLASLCDRALAEVFLAEIEEDNKRDEQGNSTRVWDPTDPPEAINKRLQLARQLLENGETEKAMLVAESGLRRATAPGIIFLVLLRQKKPALADSLFSSLLERTGSDRTADATSVSLLSSYVFTPSVFVTLTRNGMAMNSLTPTLPPPELSPRLRRNFFAIAGQLLLRPLDPTELELTSAGLTGTIFTIQRLLPLFEQHEPAIAAGLQHRLNALAQGKDQVIPEKQRRYMNAGFESKEKPEEAEVTLASIERTPGIAARNHLYAMAARAAVMKNDPKARDFADKIDDTEIKKSVRAFVDFILVSKALEQGDSERALNLVRTGELSHFQRAWSYLEIAALFKSSPPEEAIESMNEALAEAGRISVASSEAAQAWVAIARRTAELDPPRKWLTVLDSIRALNKVPEYTGEEKTSSVRFKSGRDMHLVQVATPSTDLAALFSSLAEDDVYQAVEIARGITYESPRSIALLGIARSVLTKNPVKNTNYPR
jgi:hypothetical protein